MPTATNGGVSLHWDEQGSGHPVLLIMGHLLPGRMWYPVLPALSTRHRVVWFDNRGTGDSDSTDTASVSDLAADACAVMDAAGTDQAHVYGVSMGGGIALQLAYESPHRVRSLVLGCTALRSPTFDEKKRPGLVSAWCLRPGPRDPDVRHDSRQGRDPADASAHPARDS